MQHSTTKQNTNTISIAVFCTLVDNWGDIGTCNRLVLSLFRKNKKNQYAQNLTIIYSIQPDEALPLTKAMNPELESNSSIILRKGTDDWDASLPAPDLIIETFSSGIPQQFKNYLHEKSSHEGLRQRARWLSIDYLTAETWADEVHGMPSLSGIKDVRRSMMIPGFSAGSAGLTKDIRFIFKTGLGQAWHRRNFLRGRLREKTTGSTSIIHNASRTYSRKTHNWSQPLWIMIFTYERTQFDVVHALQSLKNPSLIHACSGKSQKDVIGEVKQPANARSRTKAFPLDFLTQAEWDTALLCCDFAFIRGEESLSRCCLAGIPFVWQAYIQAEGHHLVKVKALLEKMEACMLGVLHTSHGTELGGLMWKNYCDLSLAVNDRDSDTFSESPRVAESEKWLDILSAIGLLRPAFKAWQHYCLKLPDLETQVLSFISDLG